MWTMPFLMVIYLKKFIWIFLLVMVNKGRLLNKGKYWFVSFKNRSMVSSKPPDNGTPNFLMPLSNMALSNPSLIILCLPKDLDLPLLFYWSIWMISSSLVQTLKWSNLWKLFFILSLNSRIWDVFKYFLRLEIAQSATGIVLSQRHYTLQLLEYTRHLACKLTFVPMDPKVKLNAHDGAVLWDVLQYRRL